jgi:hypothetical protein
MVSWQNGVAGCFRVLPGACGASRCRPTDHCLGRPAPPSGQAPARRARPHRRLPRRRTLRCPLAHPLLRPAGPSLGPGRYPGALVVSEAPLPTRLREPVPRGHRLDLVAPVLPHPAGPARPAPHHSGQARRSLRPGGRLPAQPGAARQAVRRQAAAGPEAADRHHRGRGRYRPPHRRRPARARGPQAGWAGPPRSGAWRGHPHRVPGPVPLGRAAAQADLQDPAAAHRAGALGG